MNGSHPNLTLGKQFFSELNLTFPLLLNRSGKRFPDVLFLSDSNLCVLPGVSFNLTSLVHYTTMDSFANPNSNQANRLDNIIVQDSLIHDRFLKLYILLLHLPTLLLDR